MANDPDQTTPTADEEEVDATGLSGGAFVELPVFGGAMLTHPDDE